MTAIQRTSHSVSLWRHSDFLKLWAGDAVSAVGSQVTVIALPLAAVVTLRANAAEMGILGAAQFVPFLILGLLAGAWVDRLPRRPVLVTADVGRALLLGTIPLAAFWGVLTMTQLYVVGLLVGVLTLFFDVAYQSYLPSLVSVEQLAEGNAKLEATRSLAQIVGPSLGGALVQWITAPAAIALDSLSFFWSALWFGCIRAKELRLKRANGQSSIWVQVAEGLRFVLRSPLLRPIAFCTATSNLFGRILFSVYVLYLVRDLGVSPASVGLIFGGGSVGAFIGSMTAQPMARRFGLGKTIAFSILLGNAALVLVPIAGHLPAAVARLLLVAQFFWGMSNPIYNVNQVSLRQAYTPLALQGRMNASMRTIVWGTVPIGYLIGGSLGTTLGLWATLVVGAVGGLFSFLWLAFSPVMLVHGLKDLPKANSAGPHAIAGEISP